MALKWISLKVKPPEGNKKATSNKKIEANKQNAKALYRSENVGR